MKCPYCAGAVEPLSFRKNYKVCHDCGAVGVPHGLYSTTTEDRYTWRRKGESLDLPKESDVTND